MSFVNLVITDSFISVISDGQVTKNNEITASHFKKFETSQNGYVIASTGYEKITNDIRKKFYYQPHLTFDDAQMLLLESIKNIKISLFTFQKKSRTMLLSQDLSVLTIAKLRLFLLLSVLTIPQKTAALLHIHQKNGPLLTVITWQMEK